MGDPRFNGQPDVFGREIVLATMPCVGLCILNHFTSVSMDKLQQHVGNLRFCIVGIFGDHPLHELKLSWAKAVSWC